MWQPRDSHGRFSWWGGGDKGPDPINEWFLAAPWWKKTLAIAAVGAFSLWLYYSGYILVFIIGAFALAWIMRLIRAFLE